MARNNTYDTPDDGPRDPRRDALHSEWLNHQRTFEQREAEEHESLGRERALYDSQLNRKHKQANLIEQIELERLRQMRSQRLELDCELVAAQEVAARAFSRLGLEYIPGRSTVADLYKTHPLPRAVAAERAGVPIASLTHDLLLKVLKYAGMIGCLLLGTIGMGALLLHIQPRSLFHSPLVVVAIGLAFVLVGGVYLVVSPAARRHGSLSASRPNDAATQRSFGALIVLVSVVIVIVALVDAKALVAINAARAMIDPNSAPPFIITFLIAAALSATYVLGTAILAFNEGFGHESTVRIEAEQEKHQDAFRREQRDLLEVTQACEALNAVDVIETRRENLTEEIRQAGQGLRESLGETYAGTGKPPELSDEKRNRLRVHQQEARFAGHKLSAVEAIRTKLSRKQDEESEDGAK